MNVQILMHFGTAAEREGEMPAMTRLHRRMSKVQEHQSMHSGSGSSHSSSSSQSHRSKPPGSGHKQPVAEENRPPPAPAAPPASKATAKK